MKARRSRLSRLPVWSPLGFLRSLAGSPRQGGELASRWADAFAADPELAGDLIRLGGVLTTIPARYEDGIEMPDPIDPHRLAYEAGRRDLALKLLAAGNVGTRTINALIEDPDD